VYLKSQRFQFGVGRFLPVTKRICYLLQFLYGLFQAVSRLLQIVCLTRQSICRPFQFLGCVFNVCKPLITGISASAITEVSNCFNSALSDKLPHSFFNVKKSNSLELCLVELLFYHIADCKINSLSDPYNNYFVESRFCYNLTYTEIRIRRR